MNFGHSSQDEPEGFKMRKILLLLALLWSDFAFGQALQPINVDSPCISISVTSTASTATALPTSTLNQIRLVSDSASTGIIFVGVGSSSVVATISSSSSRTSTPILIGEDTVFTRDPNGGTFISAITASTKVGTLYACVGSGN
jgi:hypothetical protein